MSAPRPNFILVHTDQFRGDCLGIAGHPDVLTPNLDRMARSGAYFPQAYSECPVCIPARHALLTGKTPGTNGVMANGSPGGRVRIRDEANTLPAFLQRHGYRTASVGRDMHQYPEKRRYGFEYVYGPRQIMRDPYSTFRDIVPLTEKHQFNNWPHSLEHGAPIDGHAARSWSLPERFHETNHSIARALEYLENRDEESPFFLCVGTVAPHPPLVPPEHYFQRYYQTPLEPPVFGEWASPPQDEPGKGPSSRHVHLHGRQLQVTRAGYYGLINHIDDQLSLLLRYLWMAGLSDNTYVLFLSDHGEMLGDHYHFRKSQPFQGSVRIPFIVSGPGIGANTRSERPVQLMDVFPTLCDLAGLEPPAGLEGVSMAPVLRGEGAVARTWVHGEHANADDRDGFHYLTDGKRKYIWIATDGSEFFFDLENDPHELRNLAANEDRAQELATWRTRLIERLEGRPEGFVANGELLPGRPYPAANANARIED